MALGWFNKKKGKGAGPASSSTSESAAPPQILIGGLLEEGLILAAPPGQDKDRFIESLARRLCEIRGLGSPAPFLSKVLEREQGISTTLDTGLAVPHARMDGLESIVAALGLVPKGMSDPKQPDLTIRAMFMFFSPNRSDAFTQHLNLLRGVSALFQPSFIEELMRDPSPAAALALIRTKEQGG